MLMCCFFMQGKGGSVFTFGVKGGYEAGTRMVERCELFSHLANLVRASNLSVSFVQYASFSSVREQKSSDWCLSSRIWCVTHLNPSYHDVPFNKNKSDVPFNEDVPFNKNKSDSLYPP